MMHHRNQIFFDKVLPEFLQTARDLFVKFSLFVQLDDVNIRNGSVEVKIERVEKDMYERSLTLYKYLDEMTFWTQAVQCYHAKSEQINVTYSDKDKVEDSVVHTISTLLKIPQDCVALYVLSQKMRLIEINQPEEVITSEENLTAIVLAALHLLVDFSKPIRSIERIRYPVECFGGLRILVKVTDESAELKVFGPHGSCCCKWINIRMEAEPRPEAVGLLDRQFGSDSPTIRLLEEMGIECTEVDRNESFITMGLDSLQRAELEIKLQSTYPAFNIPTGIAEKCTTIAEMDAYIYSYDNVSALKNKDATAYSSYVPLSPLQRRLVFLSELEPLARAQFNEPVILAMKHEVFDESRLCEALNTVAMRHTILRTIYIANAQTILSGTEAYFSCRRSCSVDLVSIVATPIDVKCGSMRVRVGDANNRVVICVVFHHIAVDGHSINIIAREIEALYSGQKLPVPLKQYSDYARQVATLNYEEELALWRKQLDGREFELLPTDKPRSSTRTYNGAVVQKRIPEKIINALKKLRQAGNCTNFCIFAAAYKFLVYKTRGIDDFPLGFPHTKKGKEFLNTVGCFVNTVPLLQKLDTSWSVADYLVRLAGAISEAIGSDVPFDVLVSDLNIHRDDSVTPLFQVLLVMDKVQLPSANDNNVVLLQCPTRFAKYEQTWYFQSSGSSFHICLEYNCDLFSQQTMLDLIDRYLHLLYAMTSSPTTLMLKDFALIKRIEMKSIFEERLSNKIDTPSATTWEMFRRNLPTRSSVVFKGERMSYKALEKKSRETAHLISSAYCSHYGELPSRDCCAALFMDRSFDLLATIFGIWRSGMVAVPINLDWPQQRVLELLKQLGNPVLIETKSARLRQTAEGCGFPVISGVRKGMISRLGGFNLLSSSDLAYITCTSGTTGTPKVVCTEFSGHCNLAVNYTERFLIHRSSHTYQVVNYGFDIFFADLTKTFANGASITLAEGLIPIVKEMNGVTNAYIMPAYLSSLPVPEIKKLDFLESIQIGGEAIQPLTLRNLLQTGIAVYQEYGVTEQTVYTGCSRMHVCSDVTEVGRPYRNLHCRLRDKDGKLVPKMYQGICYLGGYGLARGYYNNREINSRAFVEFVFGKEFRTGDVLKGLGGRLHLVGRDDQRVKIRGRTIDILEVQNQITSHEDVEGCTIGVGRESNGNEIVSYVILKKGCKSTERLEEFLSGRLPKYAIPKHFVILEQFPLNQNGKIDKQRLPVPSRQSLLEARPPRGETELAIVNAFRRYTGRDHAANECFFESGGDSVKAMLVVQHLASRGYSLDLPTFFSLRTAEKIASYLENMTKSVKASRYDHVPEPFIAWDDPLSPTQKRIWFLAKMFPERDSYVIQLQLDMIGDLNVEQLKHSFNSVLINHPATRSFVSKDNDDIYLVRKSGTECFYNLSQSHLDIPQVDGYSLVTARLTSAEDCHRLDIRMHHIISDGRSLAIIGEQLAAAYNDGHFWIPKHTQEQMKDSDDRSIGFWKEYLKDFTPTPIQAKGDDDAFSGEAGYIEEDLDFSEEVELTKLITDHGCTIYHILVLCYVHTLRMAYDLDDVVIGTTVANRTPENLNIVGLFANTIPLRFNFECVELEQQLRYVTDQILSALEHRSTPLARIIEEVVNERASTMTPLFQHVITFESASMHDMPKMSGLETNVTEPRSKFAQFDQSWIFTQRKKLSLLIQYDRSRFRTSSIRDLLKAFKASLRSIVKHRSLSAPKKQQALKPPQDAIQNHCLGRIFVKQAGASPSRICIEDRVEELSYTKFLGLARGLAQIMERVVVKHHGEALRPDDVVCIILEDSIENHVAIEAVHLLGCAYLCLSPALPAKRILYVLADCRARLVVTNIKLPSSLTPVLRPSRTEVRSGILFSRSTPDSLAYLIYTSGTSGTPKGVCVSNESTLRMLAHATQHYHFRPGGRVMQFTSTSFDASISNTFGALLNGGVISIRDNSAELVEDVARRQPIAVLHMTPMVMEMFGRDDLALLPDVETWSYGGESLSESTLNMMIKQGQNITQLYGPTEATCYQTLLRMKKQHSPSCLGRVISDSTYGLCSFSNHITTRLHTGQLYLSGELLARGYIAMKSRGFLRNQHRTFADRALRRNHSIYLTGDRVHEDPAGYLHYLGRNDDQVKVKGHRIQLAEVESVARGVEGIENAVAVVQHDKANVKHIVLFYIGIEDNLMESLKNSLPHYMLPSITIRLDEFPHTVNKKIDRAKLSARGDVHGAAAPKSEPMDQVEEKILEIFGAVLKRFDLNVNSNFFQSGGHSLLVVRLVDQIETSFEVAIPFLKVFECPRVRDLAKLVKSLQENTTLKKTRESLTCHRDDERPTMLQKTLLRCFKSRHIQRLYDISLSVTLKRSINKAEMVAIVNRLSMVHPSLRTRFVKKAVAQGHQRLVLSGTECFQNLIGQAGELCPFTCPPFAVCLDGDQIIIVINHVITDGHSMRVIVESLSHILAGGTPTMDDGLLLHSWLQQQFDERVGEDMCYWKEKLKDFVYNQLPTTYPRLVALENVANTLTFCGTELASTIQNWARNFNSTPFVVALTFLSRALQQLSNNPDLPIAIGFPVNLRTQKLQRSVGLGVSTVLVAEDTRGNPAEVLQRMTRKVAEAISHAFVSYEELVQQSPTERLFSVMFVYDNYSVVENELLVVRSAPCTSTKFEITVFFDYETNAMQIEYNKALFDEGYVRRVEETLRSVTHDWNVKINPPISRPLLIEGVVYDSSDIWKLLKPFSITNVCVELNDELKLYYNSEVRMDDRIEHALSQLPAPLRPRKIIFERKSCENFALSAQQLQMYYLSLKSPSFHVLPFLKKFPNTVAPKHLQQAILYVSQRHESLRTAFFEEDGDARQIVLSMTEAYIDVKIHKVNNVKDEVTRFLQTQVDLNEGPPVRVAVFDNKDCLVAALLLHHIISDAWSTDLLEHDLMAILKDLDGERVPAVHRQNYSYRDFCCEKRAAVKMDEDYISAVANADSIPLLQGDGRTEVFHFDVTEVVAQKWMRSHGVSWFAVVLLLLSQCVMKQFGLRSINIGSPTSNRKAKTKSVIGYFLNNVVFHINRDEGSTRDLSQLHRHIGKVLSTNIPYLDLASTVRQVRKNLTPIFQIYFNCRYDLESSGENDDDDDELLSMIPVESEFPIEVDLDKHHRGYRVTFRMLDCIPTDIGRGIVEELRYQILGLQKNSCSPILNPQLSREHSLVELVKKLAEKVLGIGSIDLNENFFSAGGNSLQLISFVGMLEEALNIEIDVADVYLMKSLLQFAKQLEAATSSSIAGQDDDTKLERTLALEAKSSIRKPATITKEHEPSGHCVDTPRMALSSAVLLFADRYGLREAYTTDTEVEDVTYAEWKHVVEHGMTTIRSSYIANMGETLRSDTILPVVGKHSSATIALCLSVVSSGAAYLPIDSSNPLERLRSLLKESRADCYLGDFVPGMTCIHLKCVGIKRKSRPLLNCSSNENLSYVIYTSGTTGTPKAVCVNQVSVINMTTSATVDFQMRPDDVTYQFTKFTFDNSVLELFMTIANGAKLLIDSKHFSPRRFVDLIEGHGITHCLLFPGIVTTFTESHFRRLAGLRYWIVGAEKFPQRLLDAATECGVNVIQNYGPTETTAYALMKHMRCQDIASNIGRPIQNTEMKLTDDGELTLRGKGLMRGYLGRSWKDTLLEGSWYPTGDHVHLLPNGDVVFDGRKDRQIKINGYRVELEEIEVVIGRVMAVRQCVAVFKHVEQVLLAFVTGDSKHSNMKRMVKDICARQLPAHMQPSHVIVLDEFPLTKNGKVDVALLSEMWRELHENGQLLQLAEVFLEHEIDPCLSLMQAGAHTKDAIALSSLYFSRFGRRTSAAQLLRYPLKDVRTEADTTQFMCHAVKQEKFRERLSKIWSKVLGRNDFSFDDHFFFVGGNSISLIKLRHQIVKEFEVEVKISDLVDNLAFSRMEAKLASLETPSETVTVAHTSPKPCFTLVFIHALYGGSLPYANLTKSLGDLVDATMITVQHPNTFGFVSDDLRYFESLPSLAQQYAVEIERRLQKPSRVLLIGASFGGTLAFEISRYLTVQCDVVAIDSGTEYHKLAQCTFSEHMQNMEKSMIGVEIDEETKFWMMANAWDLLGMLGTYNPNSQQKLRKVHVFSIDGSDNGWSRFAKTSVTRIAGTHTDMLSLNHCDALASEIIRVLTEENK